ncbi:unnamed protein product [Ascophyllum nodosum]
MTASFGVPAPLPGQPGFKVKASELMARETAEMEVRLSRLKTDLKTETEMRVVAGPKIGGARWRSARADRGSVRSYAKDVRNRHNQQQQHCTFGISSNGGLGSGGRMKPQAGTGARAAAALRDDKNLQPLRQTPTKQGGYPGSSNFLESVHRDSSYPDFAAKEVGKWSVRNTLDWLDSVGLGTHRAVFEQNEISGPILLEVRPEDLDYMNVHVLAHRKRILGGIEELRRGSCRLAADVHPPPVPSPQSEDRNCVILTRVHSDGLSVRDGEIRHEEKRQPLKHKRVQHWFHFKTMSDNRTEDNDDRRDPPVVHPANGRYNDATAHSSFADAVVEWRRGQEQNVTGAASSPSKRTPCNRAPVAGPIRDEESIPVNDAGAPVELGLLNGSAIEGCWTNPFASPRASESMANSLARGDHLMAPESLEASPLLLSTAAAAGTEVWPDSCQAADIAPTLDEEAEHAAFRRAVAEWNRHGPDDSTNEEGALEDAHGRADRGNSPRNVATSRRAAEAVAEALGAQMDFDHRAQARELEEKKREALKGLEAARCSSARSQTSRMLSSEIDHGCTERVETGRGEPPIVGESRICQTEGSEGDEEDKEGSAARGPRKKNSERVLTPSAPDFAAGGGRVDCEGPRTEAEGGRGIEIEFLESVLGVDLSAERGGVRYFVDEDGSVEDDDL